MQDILNQLGELVLGSVPTMIFFVVLVIAYAALVRKPLETMLAERHARTSGAMDQARSAISASEAKAAEYEAKLRDARTKIFENRQAMLKQWNTEREKALELARHDAQRRIGVAREAVQRAGDEAKQQLQTSAAQLSDQILKAILPTHRGGAAVQG
ncbi:ATP synthase F0 subunit B [Terriglobus saanensis]|uniref:ATP synthase subunit b n=1 Tax=Terriglobus saanensis (strain ATCC BAA-1853 / DSM 23119 / SP1PR4) TaxID=401053 RepID=E8V841_TERSS|nr:ATP synthase F0 subunit B [Terriglobus saanensis]ADV84023.1 H+transporting two-sector ATPase B/B' subunit [Terriglobus saanensis SP1PR4]